MSARALPSAPSFSSLRRQAKQLRRAINDGDDSAVQRFVEHHPKFSSSEDVASAKPTLADAQSVIAREYGYASWAKLKAFAEAKQVFWSGVSGPTVERFLHWACPTEARGPQPDYIDHAKAMLAEFPTLRDAGLFVSVAIGDVDAVRKAIQDDATQTNTPCGPRDWLPLAYAVHSQLHLDPEFSDGIAACAELLLENGADATLGIDGMGTQGKSRVTPFLLTAITHTENALLIEQLLKHGADPVSTGAYYYTALHTDTRILDLLYDHGAPVGGPEFAANCSGTLQHRLRFHPEDTSILAWYLDRGADPSLPNPGTRNRTPLHSAVQPGIGLEVVRFLLEKGADPKLKDDDGRSPVAMAVRSGDTGKVNVLLEHGGVDDATAYDRLIGAAEQKDEEAVQQFASDVDLSDATRDQRSDFLDAGQSGNLPVLRAMLLAGMDVAVTTSTFQATALDRAALNGQAEAVRYLIDQGAPLEVKHQWGGTPLGSALHGLVHFPNKEGDYAGVVDALLKAGAERNFIKGPMGDEAVDRVLREHGVIEPEGIVK